MTKKFQKKVEDFECEHCGKDVFGDGYTNHCPGCLWSKHVDIFPGDRKNKCKGMMEPMDVFQKDGVWRIVQKCTKCQTVFQVRTKENDSLDVIKEILQKKDL